MKNIITSIVLALALSFTVQGHAQLVEAPASSPTASGAITESQFTTLLNAAPSNAVTGASTTYQSLQFFGTHLTLASITYGGITTTTQATLTGAQVSTFLAGLPALPNGELVANIKRISVYRIPSGLRAFVQFSQ